jgi:hypothetical protein
MDPKGLVLAMMEPPAGFEEEFQDWYDTEHVPDRMSVEGYETGHRFVCYSGFPRYVAMYDLRSLREVMANPHYSKNTGQGVTAWTHRLRTKVLGRYRFTGDQMYPGNALMGGAGPVIRLMVLRFRGAPQSDEKNILAGLHGNFDGLKGLAQFRLWRGVETPGDYIASVEFQTNVHDFEVNPAPFGTAIKHMDLINSYTPYWRQIIHRKQQ